MHGLLLQTLCGLFFGWPTVGDTPVNGPPTQSVPAANPTVEIKQTPSSRIVSKEAVGAYWRIGPLLSEMAEYMNRYELRGPMFVRYLGSPSRATASAIPLQVGCFVDATHEPQPPFLAGTSEGGTVAFLKLDDVAMSPSTHFRSLDLWIKANHYVAAGPVTEIYDLPISPKTGPKTLRPVEVHVPILPLVEDQIMPAEFPIPIEEDAEIVFATETLELAKQKPLMKAARSEPITARRDTSICALVGESRFDEVAQVLFPDGGAFDAEAISWLAQVVSRMAAASRGIDRMDPGGAEPLRQLVAALEARFKARFGHPLSLPKPVFGGPATKAAEAESTARRGVVREVDHVLARISTRSVDAESCLYALCDILEKVARLRFDSASP